MQPEHIREEIISDVPISSKSDDLFDRASWAEQLANVIVGINSPNAFTVGIVGPWGSGKTSMMNMIVEELRNQGLEIVRFSPWLFSSQEKILQELLKQLMEALSPSGSKKTSTLKSLLASYQGQLVEEVATAINVAATITGNPAITTLETVARPLEKRILERLIERVSKRGIGEDSVEQLRQKITREMRKLDRNIVIVIDDIDRLDSEEIRLIFKLVNLTLSFPHIVFVLAYDEEVVCAALQDVQGIEGRRYLEKIIQQPVPLPRLSSKQISELAQVLIGRYIERMPMYSHQDETGQYMLTQVFQDFINPRLETPRKAFRFTNAIQFRSLIYGRDIHPADLLAMTMIQLEYPELENWIWNNRNALCADYPNALSPMTASNAQLQASFENVLAKYFDPSTSIRVGNIMGLLFPTLREADPNPLGNKAASSDISGHVCRIRNLELFFVPSNPGFSEREHLLNVLSISNWDEMVKEMKLIDEAGQIEDLIDLAAERRSAYSNTQLATIATAMLRFSGVEHSVPSSISWLSPESKLCVTAENILVTLTKETASKVVHTVLAESDYKGLEGITYFIRDERLAQLGDFTSRRCCLSSKDYIDVVVVYLNKVADAIHELLSDGNRLPILMADAISEDYPDEAWPSRWESTRNRTRKDPYYAVLLEASKLNLFTSLTGNGRSYQRGPLSKDTRTPKPSLEELHLSLSSVINDSRFASVSRECKTRVGALYLLQSQNELDGLDDEVSSEEAERYIDAALAKRGKHELHRARD